MLVWSVYRLLRLRMLIVKIVVQFQESILSHHVLLYYSIREHHLIIPYTVIHDIISQTFKDFNEHLTVKIVCKKILMVFPSIFFFKHNLIKGRIHFVLFFNLCHEFYHFSNWRSINMIGFRDILKILFKLSQIIKYPSLFIVASTPQIHAN